MIDTPHQEQVNLENIKNQITLSEGELQRLRELQESERYGIGELVKEKKYKKEEIDALNAEKSRIQEEIDSLSEQLEDASETILQAQEVKAQQEQGWSKLEAARQQQSETHNAKHNELSELQTSLASKEEVVQLAENDVIAREASVAEKENKIAALIADLQITED